MLSLALSYKPFRLCLFLALPLSLSVQLFAEYPQFSRAHAVGGSRQSTAYSVGTDGAGNCFLAGSLGSTINVGSIDFGTTNFASSGGIDGFLAKFNSFGVCQWARRFSGAGRQEVFSVAVHSSGDCYVV